MAITAIIKKKPAIGWVRADLIPENATINELLKLRSRITELENEVTENYKKPAVGSEDLLQDEDILEIRCSYVLRKYTSSRYTDYNNSGKLFLTVNQIFASVAPRLINEATNGTLKRSFAAYFEEIAKIQFSEYEVLKKSALRNFDFNDSDIDTCIVQLRAIGLIKESIKPRSIKDNYTYWSLTPYGDIKMVQLRALKKTT